MDRRAFLVGSAALGSSAFAGCLGVGETDHLAEFRENLDDRGLDLNGVEMHGDDVVVAEFQSETPTDDIAAAGLAFVDQIEAGWSVSMLEGIAREERDIGWYAKAEWAHEFLAGELSPEEFGALLNDTIQPVIVIEDGDELETN